MTEPESVPADLYLQHRLAHRLTPTCVGKSPGQPSAQQGEQPRLVPEERQPHGTVSRVSRRPGDEFDEGHDRIRGQIDLGVRSLICRSPTRSRNLLRTEAASAALSCFSQSSWWTVRIR